MLTTWVIVWCAAAHLSSIRQELIDWFRDDGEVEWEKATPEEQLEGVKILLATATSKRRGCFLFACQHVPSGMKKTLDADKDILDYLIVDAITA